MIKKVILALAFAIAIPVAVCAQKFGVVDVQTIITGMPEFTAMQNQITEASKKYEDEFKKLQEEFDKKFAEYQGLAQDTPAQIKERRESELTELGQKIDQFRNTASQDLQRQQQTLMAPIEEKIMEAIKSVGKEGSYTFIFQEGQAAYQGAEVINVTDAVKGKLGVK